MRKLLFICLFCLSGLIVCANAAPVLIDDFEIDVSGGPAGTVDFGSGNGSTLVVTSGTDKTHGQKSLKVEFDAVTDGYMWIARGFELDSANTEWLLKPDAIDWKQYNAISFMMNGANAKGKVAFDIKDNGNELWRFLVDDNFNGWKKITIKFDEFFARGDWQPSIADKNGVIDFPLKSFQFEPLAPSKGVLYFDEVEVTSK